MNHSLYDGQPHLAVELGMLVTPLQLYVEVLGSLDQLWVCGLRVGNLYSLSTGQTISGRVK